MDHVNIFVVKKMNYVQKNVKHLDVIVMKIPLELEMNVSKKRNVQVSSSAMVVFNFFRK